MDWLEVTDLPQLQSVVLDNAVFCYVHSVVFESDGMDGLMNQICRNYNPFNLVNIPFGVIGVVEMRSRMHPTTSGTHSQ